MAPIVLYHEDLPVAIPVDDLIILYHEDLTVVISVDVPIALYHEDPTVAISVDAPIVLYHVTQLLIEYHKTYIYLAFIYTIY